MTVRPGLRAALVLAGLAATVTVLAIGLAALAAGVILLARRRRTRQAD